jgi:hypothetical protein
MARDRDIAAFDLRAPGYESGWLGRLHHQIADRTADLALTLTPAPRRILDVGCGTGYLLRQLAARCPQAELAGIDPAPAMIEAARAAAADDRLQPWSSTRPGTDSRCPTTRPTTPKQTPGTEPHCTSFTRLTCKEPGRSTRPGRAPVSSPSCWTTVPPTTV